MTLENALAIVIVYPDPTRYFGKLFSIIHEAHMKVADCARWAVIDELGDEAGDYNL